MAEINENGCSYNKFRSVSAQFVAAMSPNLLIFDLGMAVSFATIAIPDLLNNPNDLSIDETQASWFGSIAFLTQPVGALLSGPLVDYFGRKKANVVANVPHLIAWTLMYLAWDVPTLFLANSLLGLGTGFMEAPISAYLGEISHPLLRGTLTTFNQCFAHAGSLTIYYLGIMMHWRRVALICLAVPVISIIMSLLSPDSPLWLLSQGKEKQALDALCFLRGWTHKEHVRQEFDQLQVYTKSLQQCELCPKNETQTLQECEHTQMNILKRFIFKLKYAMYCKETLRPMSLILLYFTFFTMGGLVPVRPNMVNMCQALGMPGDAKNTVFLFGIVSFIMSIIQAMIIKILGKRKIAITGMLGAALCHVSLSFYVKSNLSTNVFSYDPNTFPTETSSLPLVLFYLMTVFVGLGVPWVIIGEIFPFKSRATAQGFAAAGDYVIKFIASKTLINLEKGLLLYGTFAVYSTFGFLGTVYLYFFLPETEGKSLEEIETYYNKDRIKIFADDPVINCIRNLRR